MDGDKLVTTKTWQPLKKGDRVSAISFGLPFFARTDEEEFERDKKFFENLGLEYWLPEGMQKQDYYYGWWNSPKVRFDQIIEVLKDPKTRMLTIFGGNGSDEVIEMLKKYDEEHGLPKRPDMLAFGFSDGDQLMNYLSQKGVVSAVESVPQGRIIKSPEEQRRIATESLRKFLFEQVIDDVDLTCLNEAALTTKVIEGKLVAANLHSRRSSYRTLISEDYGSILLLESGRGGRKPEDGLKFQLSEMKRQGEKPRAIVLSASDIEGIDKLTEIAASSEIPIFFGAPYGHIDTDLAFKPLPLNTKVTIKCSAEKALMSVEAVRRSEDIEQVIEMNKSCLPFTINAKPISKEIIKIGEPLRVEVVKENWVTRVSSQEEKDFLFCQSFPVVRRSEAPDFGGMDLSGKNIAIDFPINGPPFEVWSQNIASKEEEKNKENFDKFCLEAAIQSAQTILLELIKTQQLQKAQSVTFLTREKELPADFNKWLKEFVTRHDLQPAFFVGKAPKETEEIFPGPPQSRDCVPVIKAAMEIIRDKREQKTFVEKMRDDKTRGKSLGGYNEL